MRSNSRPNNGTGVIYNIDYFSLFHFFLSSFLVAESAADQAALFAAGMGRRPVCARCVGDRYFPDPLGVGTAVLNHW